VALFSASGDKVPFAIATTAAARDAGIRAGDLVKELAPLVSGRGGGKPDLAQGSGTDAAGIDPALARLRDLVGSTR
jgi:alanyl-tRNA synthetase